MAGVRRAGWAEQAFQLRLGKDRDIKVLSVPKHKSNAAVSVSGWCFERLPILAENRLNMSVNTRSKSTFFRILLKESVIQSALRSLKTYLLLLISFI